MKKTFILFLILLVTAVAQAQPAPQPMVHPWQGKRVAYFGDSITDPRVKAGTEKWWTLLSEWLGITPYCYAISGRQWNDIPRQTNALLTEHGQDFDAILIFMGTNDYNAAIPLGEWYEETTIEMTNYRDNQPLTETRRLRTLAINDSTYRGRINKALDEMKRTFPTKQIVLLTPIHRAIFTSRSKGTIQPDDRHSNTIGLWLEQYVDDVSEAGRIWAMPVIDLYSVSGLNPALDEQASYFTSSERDRLHPNDSGYLRIARTLYYQLMALPCDF